MLKTIRKQAGSEEIQKLFEKKCHKEMLKKLDLFENC